MHPGSTKRHTADAKRHLGIYGKRHAGKWRRLKKNKIRYGANDQVGGGITPTVLTTTLYDKPIH